MKLSNKDFIIQKQKLTKTNTKIKSVDKILYKNIKKENEQRKYFFNTGIDQIFNCKPLIDATFKTEVVCLTRDEAETIVNFWYETQHNDINRESGKYDKNCFLPKKLNELEKRIDNVILKKFKKSGVFVKL